jgi:hypothetical protein
MICQLIVPHRIDNFLNIVNVDSLGIDRDSLGTKYSCCC